MSPVFVRERFKDLLWILAIIAVVLGTVRFGIGLGAATNMSDALPWGWWKIFNMVAGAALATSGFVIAAVIYILKLEKYRPVARLSVIIGFLGYGASLAALMFDIGLPHRGWHAFFMWNPHSFLFEVFWCVSVYWGITALELLPILTERFPFPKVTHLLHEIMLPFVVLGITLSTMHHSSLGSLFLASPTRLHPLWYSLWIPPEFLISAIGAGLSVIVLLKLGLNWLYEREHDFEILGGLAKASAAFLGLFLLVKVADFTYFGKWGFVFGPDLTWESYLYWVEISLQAIIPVILLSLPFVRRSPKLMGLATTSAFIGLTMHRLDTGITGYFRSAGEVYIPSLSEFLFGVGVLAGAGIAFLFLVEHFFIFDEPDHDAENSWTLAEARSVFLGARTKRMVAMSVLVVPLTLFGFQSKGTGFFTPIAQPAQSAVLSTDALRTELLLDADGDGDGVVFPHEKHKAVFAERNDLTEEQTCVECHHLNLPGDHNTPCRTCHQDMELPTPLFDMAEHRDRFEGEEWATFAALDLADRDQNFEACFGCHEDDPQMEGLDAYATRGFDHVAPGFRYSMHGSCMTCHRRVEEDPTDAMSLGNCKGCHATDDNIDEPSEAPDAHELVQLGDDLVLAGDPETAEAHYRKAIELEPDEATTAWYRLGVLLQLTGHTDEALGALERATHTEGHRDARRAMELIEQIITAQTASDTAERAEEAVGAP